VNPVRDWLGIQAPVGRPAVEHQRRRVEGFDCCRQEVSGLRVWGWAQRAFHTPERFFKRFFIANYCPLLFLEESGRNRTPDRLPAHEQEALFRICDRALRRTVECLRPAWVLGIGRFAEGRARASLDGLGVQVGRITHPSPACPKANRGWERMIIRELTFLGIPGIPLTAA